MTRLPDKATRALETRSQYQGMGYVNCCCCLAMIECFRRIHSFILARCMGVVYLYITGNRSSISATTAVLHNTVFIQLTTVVLVKMHLYIICYHGLYVSNLLGLSTRVHRSINVMSRKCTIMFTVDLNKWFVIFLPFVKGTLPPRPYLALLKQSHSLM